MEGEEKGKKVSREEGLPLRIKEGRMDAGKL